MDNKSHLPEMLSVKETAQRLGISYATCLKAAHLQELPFEKILGQFRISRAYVDAICGGPWRPHPAEELPPHRFELGYEPGSGRGSR